MKIKSTLNQVELSEKKRMITFLSNVQNLKRLLPPEKIEEWKFPEPNACTFKIKGISDFGMKLSTEETKISEDSIKFLPYGKVPFSFNLAVNFNPLNLTGEVNLLFEAEVNTALSFMLKTPLTNLFNYFMNALMKEK